MRDEGGNMVEEVMLPDFRYFMVTWGVGGEFGGMTAMCLARARTMAQYAGVHAPVLTFEIKPDYTEITEALLKSGHLIDGMEICNIYHYYRSADLDSREAVPEEQDERLYPPGQDIQSQTIRDGDGQIFCRITRSLDAEREYFREYQRPDGTVFLTETTEYSGDGTESRQLRLLDSGGRSVGLYRSREEFFRTWMLELADSEPSVFIADSVKTTKFTGTLRGKHTMKMAVMHNSHIAGGGEPLLGKLAVGRRDVALHSQRWDGVLFLTERHRRDFMDRFGEANNLFVLSNPASRAAELPAFSGRIPNRGVMVCRLEQAKNVFAAIDVIALVKQSIPAIRLDIYGSGRQRHALQERIDELHLQENVVLHGHVPNAGEQFRTAVFSLLTSRKEGQPLVLLESQGRGCPPVSFNIRYGPDDVISDGDNGFLVPEGDVRTAAEHVLALCTNDDLARTMSQKAWKSSERYGYPEVLKRFGSIVDQAWKQRGERVALTRMSFRPEELSMSGRESTQLAGSFSWKQTSGPDVANILDLSLQFVPHDVSQPRWISGTVLARTKGRLDVQFDVPAQYLDGAGKTSDTHDAFVIARGSNVLFRQRLDLNPE